MSDWKFKLTPGARKRIEENSLKKFTPEQRERLKKIAGIIEKNLKGGECE